MVIISIAGRLAFIGAGLLFFCLTAHPQRRAAPDLIIINARVRTMASPGSTAEAVAVTGTKISSVGTSKRISSLAGVKTKIIDAGGRLVLPGFNDSHAHFMAIGNKFSSIDLKTVRSAAEAAEKIADYARFLPKGRWILGGNWDSGHWTPGRELSRTDIDPHTADNPVFIYHSNTQIAFANGPALRLAGIGKETKDPAGGSLDRGEDGELTGMVRGRALEMIRRVVPTGHIRDWPAIAETATNYAASFGVTSVTDTQSDDHAAVYRSLERQGKLKTRIYDCVSLFDRADTLKASPADRDPEKMVRTGCVKGFSDGNKDEAPALLKHVLEADRAGFQVLVHALGGQPNSIVLGVLESAARQNGMRGRRFRIEHAHRVDDADIPRFVRAGIIASAQPYLFYGGPTKSESYRKLAALEGRVAFGADAPMTDLNPLLGIHAAVMPADHENGLSVYEAVHGYTRGSAYAEFQERAKGAIERGMLADLVILSRDIFTIEPDEIPEASVVLTVVGGRVVYEAAPGLQK